ncbi:NBS-containing resistance-like protein [Trifolium medium]|uniref:NBS-containing resistance-like protein n=1 Tax=Trifolium medium TaxID=97028 RepID=A0A392N2S0_9FABA|nr:NBS-containing resistance-like protein [Trifolium medium]
MDGKTRRLSIITSLDNVLKSTNNSHFRAIHVFEKGGSLEHIMGKLCSQSRIMKAIPKSVGELQNLETLDLRDTLVHEIPSEINKLIKLRHLLAYHRNYEAKYSLLGFTTGVLVEKGIKNLTSLQNLYYVEVDHGGIDLIEEMKMLRKLRRLGLRHVRREHGNALSAAIVEMKHLENLNITTIVEDETLNLNFVSSPPQLRRLHLKVRLETLPEWIPKLEFVVEI